MTLKLRRGNAANFGALTLQAGEPAFVLDTGKLYVGDGTNKVLINPDPSASGVASVNTRTGAVVLTAADVGLGNVTNESKATLLASAALTGTPTAPTASAGANTTQLATTAFVEAVRVILANADALKAPLASPPLTGVPTAPTAATATNTTQIATTAYVKAQGYITSSGDIDGGTF